MKSCKCESLGIYNCGSPDFNRVLIRCISCNSDITEGIICALFKCIKCYSQHVDNK